MFRPHQLLTLNAKQAEMIWFNTGKLTLDLKAVCTAITTHNFRIIQQLYHETPQACWVKNYLKFTILHLCIYFYRQLCDFIDSTEGVLETILRHLKLPVSQRKELERSSWEILTTVETLLEKT